MSQSLAKITVHVAFSTKGREPCLPEDVRQELWPYAATVLRNIECPAVQIGGAADHMHILCVLSKNLSVAQLVEKVKTATSKWLKTKDDSLANFHWQNGYGAFSVSPSHVERVKEYIAGQEEHHRKTTFQDELRLLLGRYGIGYDERYVWD
jgi:putative transposase